MDDDSALHLLPPAADWLQRRLPASPPTVSAIGRKLPLLSVVVGAGHDALALQNCLAAVLAQDLEGSRYEIVVVDTGNAGSPPAGKASSTSADGEETIRRVVLDAAQRGAGAPAVQYLSADGQASGRTDAEAVARNRGWHFARGTVIAFLDASLLPAPDWLRQGLAALTNDVAAVCGAVRVPIAVPPCEDEREAAELAACGRYGSNCFIRQAALAAVGGYDERFPADWHIDADLQLSLIEHAGGELTVGKAPLAVVTRNTMIHSRGSSLSAQRNLQFDSLLTGKHPKLQPQVFCKLSRSLWRWGHLLLVTMLGLMAAAALAAQFVIAAMALGLWLLLTMLFCSQRLLGYRHDLRYVVEMLLTSIAVPPLAVFWRCVGALRYRRPAPWGVAAHGLMTGPIANGGSLRIVRPRVC